MEIEHREVATMGTIVTIDLFGAPQHHRELESLFQRVEAHFSEIDALCSPWKRQSPLSQFRRGELAEDALPPLVQMVIEHCRDLTVVSEGWFDPWALAGGFDPTGFVKGWAARGAVDLLSCSGAHGIIVNAAGDVATAGTYDGECKFRVGIIDPDDSSSLVCRVESPGAVATSGTQQRGEHLLNPFTGSLEVASKSATVTGPDLGIADGLATALSVAGPSLLAAIDRLVGYEGFVIDRDGQWFATTAFPFVATNGVC